MIQTGQRLLAQQKYTEAQHALQAARTLYPGDAVANHLLQQANQGVESARNTPAAKTVPPEAKKAPEPPAATDARALYQKHMAAGQQHLQANQFAAAAVQFEAALRVVPGDPAATQLLQRARKGK
jgi:hypothetical protein